MSALQLHRFWLAVSLFALLLLVSSGPLLHLVRNTAVHNLTEAKAAYVKSEQDFKQLQSDVITAHKLSGQIDRARAEQVLAPADRLKAAAALEDVAAVTHLTHFAYTLSPEQTVSVQAGGETQHLASTTITLAADAADDSDVYVFLGNMQRVMPGRLRLEQMNITRPENTKVSLSAVNVHFNATVEWLSNGAAQAASNTP